MKKTSRKELTKAYDALSFCIQNTQDTITEAARLPPEQSAKASKIIANCLSVQREQGYALICMLDNVSARCGAEFVAMCERLVDKSACVIQNITAKAE